jgi:Family of unknown function (DUF5317)
MLLSDDVVVTLILGAIVLAIAIGYVIGGSLRNLSHAHIRWPVLALLGLGLQLVPAGPNGSGLGFALLMLSYALLMAFALMNVRSAGFPLIVIGLVLNALVIGVNHGMPVERHALIESGQGNTLLALEHDGGAKHHLATAQDRVLFLGDVIAVPRPAGQVVSVGDVFTYAGVIWFVLGGMRSRKEPVASGDSATSDAMWLG